MNSEIITISERARNSDSKSRRQLQGQPQQQIQVSRRPSAQVQRTKIITLRTPDTCRHTASAEVTLMGTDGATDGEVICGACGIVKTEDMIMSARPDVHSPMRNYNPTDDDMRQAQVTSATAAGNPRVAVPIAALGAYNGGGSSNCSGGGGSSFRTRSNLYLELSVGGRPDRTLRGEKYVRRVNDDLGTVSNIAQKLRVPNHVSSDIWSWYRRLRAQLHMTKSKCLVLAFYRVCRQHGCPIDESKLLECIRLELGVRHAHTYLHVVMEASGHLTADGEMVLRRMGFLELGEGSNGDRVNDNYNNYSNNKINAPSGATARVPADTSFPNQNNSIRYNLGCEISAMSRVHGPEIAGRIAHRARAILPGITRCETNARRAARVAVRMAERRVCGAGGSGGRWGNGNSSNNGKETDGGRSTQ